MKFVQLEGMHPLEKPKWEGNYLFPRQLFKVRVQWGALPLCPSPVPSLTQARPLLCPGVRRLWGPYWPEQGGLWWHRWLLSVMLLPYPACGKGKAASSGSPWAVPCSSGL